MVWVCKRSVKSEGQVGSDKIRNKLEVWTLGSHTYYTIFRKNESVWRKNSAFYKILNLFSVFFTSYHFVSHTKFSVSLYSETSETNLLFRYFASLIFASDSLRFASKQNVGTP